METTKAIEAIRWYENRASHGRGRFSAEAKDLLRRGWLRMEWTSATCWVMSITDKGRRVLHAPDEPEGIPEAQVAHGR